MPIDNERIKSIRGDIEARYSLSHDQSRDLLRALDECRAELAREKEAADHFDSIVEKFQNERDAAKREIERMRGALEKLLDTEQFNDEFMNTYGVMIEAALSPAPEAKP